MFNTKRKTLDEFRIFANYGEGAEEVGNNVTKAAAERDAAQYRASGAPGVEIKLARIPNTPENRAAQAECLTFEEAETAQVLRDKAQKRRAEGETAKANSLEYKAKLADERAESARQYLKRAQEIAVQFAQ